MSWNKIFIISFAIILISCAKNIIQNTYSYYDENENLSYLKALYEENSGNTNKALNDYYELYKKYDDEYYFNQAVILGMKTKDEKLVNILSTNLKNEASVVINTLLSKENQIQDYNNLKFIALKYKKEFYLYKVLSLCNNAKKSFIQDIKIQTMCQNDKEELLNTQDYKNKKPFLYDLEYKNFSYPLLLKELLEFDAFYNNSKSKQALLKNVDIKKLDCSKNLKECLSTLDILLNQKDYDTFFSLAQQTKNNISYDMKNFNSVMEFNAFYFKLLENNEKLAYNFLKDLYFSPKNINPLKYHEMLSKNNMQDFIKDIKNNIDKYNFLYTISIQKAMANQTTQNLSDLKFSFENVGFDDLKYYLIISSNEIINEKIKEFRPDVFLSKKNPFKSIKKSLDYFYQGDCNLAFNALKDIKDEKTMQDYQVMIDEYIFDIEQLKSVLENCIEQKR